MKKYDAYKESGIEWIGEIPEHWSINQIKRSLKLLTDYDANGSFSDIAKNVNRVENDILKYAWFVRTTDLEKYSDIRDIFNDFIWIDKLTYNYLKKSKLFGGELLLAKRGDIGRIYLMPKTQFPASLAPNLYLARLNENIISSKFAYYFLSSSFGLYQLSLRNKSTTIGALYKDDFKSLEFIFPPLAEQTAIAQYLDAKTQTIDQKINLLEKKISYYKELRKSIINETVTKGLDKTIKLKDSGIDWIGKIPEHWEVKRFKDAFDIFTGNSISDKTGYENPIDAIPYVATKDIDFDTGQIDFNNGIYISKSDNFFKKTKSNTSLICIEGANAGKKIGFTEAPVSFVNKLCAIKGKSYISDDKYNFYYLNSVGFSEQFFALISGLIGGVSINNVKEILVLLPTLKEQIAIAEFLDHKTQSIDKIVANIQNQITALKELRKTLINDVVTGKIKVIQ